MKDYKNAGTNYDDKIQSLQMTGILILMILGLLIVGFIEK